MSGYGQQAGTLQAQKLVGASFRLLLAHFRILFVLAFAPALIEEALFIAAMPPQLTGDAPQITPALLVTALVSSLVSHLVIALVTLAAVDCIAGRSRSLDAYVRIVLANVAPIFVIGTLLSIVAGMAAIFLVIPGLYVYAQFLVWLPCVLYERRGLGALARAQSLTKGHRWMIVGALGTLLLIFVGAIVFLGMIWGAIALASGGIVASLLSSVLSAFSYAIVGIFGALVYLELRAMTDGASAADIAASL